MAENKYSIKNIIGFVNDIFSKNKDNLGAPMTVDPSQSFAEIGVTKIGNKIYGPDVTQNFIYETGDFGRLNTKKNDELLKAGGYEYDADNIYYNGEAIPRHIAGNVLVGKYAKELGIDYAALSAGGMLHTIKTQGPGRIIDEIGDNRWYTLGYNSDKTVQGIAMDLLDKVVPIKSAVNKGVDFVSNIKQVGSKIVDRYQETKAALDENPIQDNAMFPTNVGAQGAQTIAKAIHPYTEMARSRAESFADVPLLDNYKDYVDQGGVGGTIPQFLGRMYANGFQGVFNTPLNMLNVIDAAAIDGKATGPAVIDTVTDILDAASVFAPFAPSSRVARIGMVDEVAPVVNAVSKRGVRSTLTDNKVTNFIGNVFDKAASTVSLIKESGLGPTITIQTLPFTQGWMPDVVDKFGLFDFIDRHQINELGGDLIRENVGATNVTNPEATLIRANRIGELTPNKEEEAENYLTAIGLQVPQDETKTKFMQEKIDQIKDVGVSFGQSYGTKAREYLNSFYGNLGSLNPPAKGSSPSVDAVPAEIMNAEAVQEESQIPVEGGKYSPAKVAMDREGLERLYWDNAISSSTAGAIDKRNVLSEELDLLNQQRNFMQQTYLNTIAKQLNNDPKFSEKYAGEYESIVETLDKRFDTVTKYAVYRAALYEEGMSDSEIHNKVLEKMYDTKDPKKARANFLNDTTINGQDISIPLGKLKVKADQDFGEPLALGFAGVGGLLESAIDSMQTNARSDLAKAGVSYIVRDIDDSPYSVLLRTVAEKAPEGLTVVGAEMALGFLGKVSNFFGKQTGLGKAFGNKAIQGGIQEVTESMALAYMGGEEYTTEENVMDIALGVLMGGVGGSKIDKYINPNGIPPTSQSLERAILSDPDDPNGGQTLIQFVQNQAVNIANDRRAMLEAKTTKTPEESLELSELQKRRTPGEIVQYYADDIRSSYFFLKNVIDQAADYSNNTAFTPDDKRRAIIGDYQATIAQIKIVDQIINKSTNSDAVTQAKAAREKLVFISNKQAEYIANPKFQQLDPDTVNYDNYLKAIYNARVQKPPVTQRGKALRSSFRSTKQAVAGLKTLQQDFYENHDRVLGGVYAATKLKSDAYNNAPVQFYDRPVGLSVAEFGYTQSGIETKRITLGNKEYDIETYKLGELFIPFIVDPETGSHAILYWLDSGEQTRFNENIELQIVDSHKVVDVSDNKDLNREFQSAGGKSTIQGVDSADVQTHHTDTTKGIIYVNSSLSEEQRKLETKKGMITQIIMSFVNKVNITAKERQIYETMLNVYTVAKEKLSKASQSVAQMFVTFGHFVQHLFNAGMTKFLKSVKDGGIALWSKVNGVVKNFLKDDEINVIIDNAPTVEADESYQVAREVAHYLQYSLGSVIEQITTSREVFYNGLTDMQKKYKFSHVAAVRDMIPVVANSLYDYMHNAIDWSKGNAQSIMMSLYSVTNYFTNKAINARSDFKRIQGITTRGRDVANSIGLQLLSVALSDQNFVSNSEIETQDIAGIAKEELIAMLDETNNVQLFDEYAAYISYVLNIDPKYIDAIDAKKVQEVLLMTRLNNHQKTMLALPEYNIIGDNGRLNKKLVQGYVAQFVTELRDVVIGSSIDKETFVRNFPTLMQNLIGDNDYIIYNAIKNINSSQDTKAEIEALYDFILNDTAVTIPENAGEVMTSLMILNNVTSNYMKNISAYPLTIAKFLGSLLRNASATVYDAEIFNTSNQDNIYAYSSYLNFPEQTIDYIKRDIAKRGNTTERLKEWKSQLIKEYTISRGFGGRNLTVNFFQIMQSMDFLEVAPMLDGTSVEKVVSYNLALAFQKYWNTKALGLRASRETQFNPVTVKNKSLVITVGKTGSGKSYWAKQYINKEGYQVFSIHDYVTKAAGEMQPSDWNNAFDQMNNDLRVSIQRNPNQIFIVDTSNLQKTRRNEFKSIARIFDLQAYAVPFYTDDTVRIKRAVANGIDETYAIAQKSDDYSQQALEKEGFAVVDETLASSNEGYVIDFINSINETVGDVIVQSDGAAYTIGKKRLSINPKKFPIQEAMINNPDLLFAIVKHIDPTTYIEVIGQFYKENTSEGIALQAFYDEETGTWPLDKIIENYRNIDVLDARDRKNPNTLMDKIFAYLQTENLPEIKTQLAYSVIDSLRSKGVIPYDASTWGDLMNTYSLDRLYAVSAYNQNYQVYLQHYIVRDLVNRYGFYAYDGDYYNYANTMLDDFINYPDTSKAPMSLLYRIAHMFGRIDELNKTLPETYQHQLTNEFSVDALNVLIESQTPINADTVIFVPQYKLYGEKTNINMSIPYREGKIFTYDTSGREVTFRDMNGKEYKQISLPTNVLENNNIVIVSDNNDNASKAFRKIQKDNAKFAPNETVVEVGATMDELVASVKKDSVQRKPQLSYTQGKFFYGVNLVRLPKGELGLYTSIPKQGALIADLLNVGYAPEVVKQLGKSVASLENKSLAVPDELIKATSSILSSVSETKNTVLSNIGYEHKLVKGLQDVYNNPDQYYYVFDNLATAIPYYVNNFFSQEQLISMDAKTIYDLVSSQKISEAQFIGLFFQRNIIDQVDTLLYLANEANARTFNWGDYAKGINKAATMQNFVSFFAERNASISGKYGAYIQALYDLATNPDYRSQWESLITYMDPDGRSESMLNEFLSRSISIDGSTNFTRIDTILDQLVNSAGLKNELFTQDLDVISQDVEGELDLAFETDEDGGTRSDMRFINKTKNSNIQFLAFMSELVAYNTRPQILLPFKEGGNFVALPLVRGLVSTDIESSISDRDSAIDAMIKFYNREYKYLDQLIQDTGLPMREEKKKLANYINKAIAKMTGKPFQKIVENKGTRDIARIKEAMQGVTDLKPNKVFTFSSLINGLNIYTASYADVNALSFITDISDTQKTLLKRIGVDIDATYSMSLAQDGFSLYEEKIYKYISLLGQIQNWAFAMYLPDAGVNRKMVAEKLIEEMGYAQIKGNDVVVNNNFSRKKIAEISDKIMNNKLPAGEYQKVLADFQAMIPGVDLAIDVLNDNQKNFPELMSAMKSVAHQTVKTLFMERRRLEKRGDAVSKEIVNAINDVLFSSTDIVQEVQRAVIAGGLQANQPTELYRRDIDQESLSDLSQLDIAQNVDEAGQTWVSESYLDQLAYEEIQAQVQSLPVQRFVVSLEKFLRTAFSTPAVRTLSDLKRVVLKYKDQIPGIVTMMENNRIFESREQFEKFYQTVFNNSPQEGIVITNEDIVQIKDYGLNVLDFDMMKKYFATKNDYKLVNMSISDVVRQKKIYDYAVDWKNNPDTLTTEKMTQVHNFIEQFDQNKVIDPEFKSVLQELDIIWREYYEGTQRPIVDINDVVLEGLGFDKQAVADRYFNAIEQLIGIAIEKERQGVEFEGVEKKLQKEVQTLKGLMDVHYPEDPGVAGLYIENRMRKYFTDVLITDPGAKQDVIRKKEREQKEKLENEAQYLNDVLTNCP